MIKSHPTPELLCQFVAGELPAALALTVSAHVDMCRACQQQIRELEYQLANKALEAADNAPLTPELNGMLADILCMEPEVASEIQAEPRVQHLVWQQQKFLLPRALQKQAAQSSKWSQLGLLWRSRLLEEERWRTSFLYIEKGGEVPEHTHKGREATLVLAGAFRDDEGLYHEGDFILRDEHHTHTPAAMPDQDCLCFTAVEAPLHFTTGVARLLNPLGRFLY